MTQRNGLLAWVLLLLAACSGDSIEDQGNRGVDTSTIGWDEPGAEPEQPLDSGSPPASDAALPQDAGTDASVADAALEDAADGGGDAGTDASADAGPDGG